IVGEDQREHGKHEEVKVAEETVVSAFMGHVSDGVDVDQEADKSDDDDHYAGKRVEEVAPVGDEVHDACGSWHGAGSDPLKQNLLVSALRGREGEKSEYGAECVKEREKHTADAEEIDGFFG